MRSFRFLVLLTVLLVLTTHRAPAPIHEQATPTPVPRTARPKPATQESASTKALSATEKFVGSWKGNFSQSNAQESGTSENLLIIQSGGKSASLECNWTRTPVVPWSDMPEEYSTTPLITKWRAGSTDLKLDGSNLRIRWGPWQLIDWSPKVLSAAQIDALKNSANLARMSVYTLKGNQLTREFDSQGGTTYTRVR